MDIAKRSRARQHRSVPLELGRRPFHPCTFALDHCSCTSRPFFGRDLIRSWNEKTSSPMFAEQHASNPARDTLARHVLHGKETYSGESSDQFHDHLLIETR